jgi:microcystin-dependent protein
MSEPFLSEIRIMSFNFAPKGWTMCNGQLLPINQNQALFSLLGTTYGGDGRVTFGLPDLRARIPMHMGGGHVLGERGGEVAHTLNIGELTTHAHPVTAIGAPPDAGVSGHTPTSAKLLAQGKTTGSNAADYNLYFVGNPAVAMASGMILPVGGNQPHNNQQPYIGLTFCIALQGIFPSQN